MNRYETHLYSTITDSYARRVFRKGLSGLRRRHLVMQETKPLPHCLSLYEELNIKRLGDNSMIERLLIRATVLWHVLDPYQESEWWREDALYFDGRSKPSQDAQQYYHDRDLEEGLYCPECGDFTEDGSMCRSCVEAEEADYDDDGYYYYDDE